MDNKPYEDEEDIYDAVAQYRKDHLEIKEKADMKEKPLDKIQMKLFSILTEFITEWQIEAEADKDRDYIADKSHIMSKALKAIEETYGQNNISN